MERVSLVKGWFDETLTPGMAKTIGKASVIMVDCDLYASAKTALNFTADLIVEQAVLFFDDWADVGLAEKSLGERGRSRSSRLQTPPLALASWRATARTRALSS